METKDKNTKEEPKKEEKDNRMPDLPDYFYLNENFTEDFKKILVDFGIVGKDELNVD